MSQKIESGPQKHSKILATIIVGVLLGGLILITIFGLLMPDEVGKATTDSLPFCWLIAIWGFFITFTSPNLLVVGETGMEVQIWRWKRLLPWDAIDKVVTDQYQLYVYSRYLPWVTVVAGIPFFQFKRRFTFHSRRANYQLIVEMMKRNLGNKFESQ